MIKFFARKGDTLNTVYEVDYVAMTWKLYGSVIGSTGLDGSLLDGRPDPFQTDRFEQVWPKREDGEVVTFTKDEPKKL